MFQNRPQSSCSLHEERPQLQVIRGFLEEVYIRLELKDCSEGYWQEKMGMFWVSGFWVIDRELEPLLSCVSSDESHSEFSEPPFL